MHSEWNQIVFFSFFSSEKFIILFQREQNYICTCNKITKDPYIVKKLQSHIIKNYNCPSLYQLETKTVYMNIIAVSDLSSCQPKSQVTKTGKFPILCCHKISCYHRSPKLVLSQSSSRSELNGIPLKTTQLLSQINMYQPVIYQAQLKSIKPIDNPENHKNKPAYHKIPKWIGTFSPEL